MVLLFLVSCIWAFSFGLIKGRLAGLDSAFISAARLFLALLVFLPFLRLRGLPFRLVISLVAIGAVQFGVMYLAYNASFQHLKAYEVALCTLTTPIFVTLLADALDRTFRGRALLASIIAVVGTAVIVLSSTTIVATFAGVALVQLSNIAFAAGQVWYRRERTHHPSLRDRDVFALLYLGGVAVALAALWPRDVSLALTRAHIFTLVYLGVIASGLGFFLWNKGATQVSAGTLAVMNNAKIPLAVACSLLFFGENADPMRLLFGGGLLLFAVWLAEKK